MASDSRSERVRLDAKQWNAPGPAQMELARDSKVTPRTPEFPGCARRFLLEVVDRIRQQRSEKAR
jgi:hypothetical protein